LHGAGPGGWTADRRNVQPQVGGLTEPLSNPAALFATFSKPRRLAAGPVHFFRYAANPLGGGAYAIGVAGGVAAGRIQTRP